MNALYVYCYANVRVNEYVVGTGPPTLTVIVADDRHGWIENAYLEPAEVEALRADWEHALVYGGWYGSGNLYVSGPPGGIGGREAMLFLGPSANAAIEAWRVSLTWDVQRREDGWTFAVHPDNSSYARLIRDDADFAWLQPKMQVDLPTFKQEAIAAQSARIAANDGRVWDGEGSPRLVTDAGKLSAYFREVGAYEEATADGGTIQVEPVKPPPVRNVLGPTPTPPMSNSGPAPTPPAPCPEPASVSVSSYGVLLAESDGEEAVQGEHTYQLRLYEGWNLIGLPGEPVNSAIDDVLGDAPVDFVLSNDGGAEDGDAYSIPSFFSGLHWRHAARFDGNWIGDITDIHGGNGYWVRSSDDATLEVPLSTDKPRPAHLIGRGWNLLAMWDQQRRPQGTTVANESVDVWLTGDYQTLGYRAAYTYQPEINSWKKIVPEGEEDFEAGYGYWVFVVGPSVLCP